MSKYKVMKKRTSWFLFLLFVFLGIGYFSYIEIMKTPDSARIKSVKNNLSFISRILNEDFKKNGVFPTSINKVKILLKTTELSGNLPNYFGWYDPWGRKILYINFIYEKKTAYIIYTLGSDFLIGGKGTAYDYFESNINDSLKVKNEIIKHQQRK